MDLPSGYADIVHLSTQVQTCHSSTRGKRQLCQLLTSSRTVQIHINSAGQVVYVPRQPSPPPNLQNLKLKSEVDRSKTFKYWRVPFIDVNQLAAAGFFFTNRGMRFVVSFVKWKSDSGQKEMMPLRNISVGVNLAHLLKSCLQNIFLLRLKHLNNSLAVVMTCAGFIWSTH